MNVLRGKREQFAQQYVETRNGAEAMRRMGLKPRSTAVNKFLTDPLVIQRVAELQQQQAARFAEAREAIIEQLLKIVFFNVADLCNVNGNVVTLKSFEEIGRGTLSAVGRITFRPGAVDVVPLDKLDAIDKLCKMLGWYLPEKKELSGTLTLQSVFEKIISLDAFDNGLATVREDGGDTPLLQRS